MTASPPPPPPSLGMTPLMWWVAGVMFAIAFLSVAIVVIVEWWEPRRNARIERRWLRQFEADR